MMIACVRTQKRESKKVMDFTMAHAPSSEKNLPTMEICHPKNSSVQSGTPKLPTMKVVYRTVFDPLEIRKNEFRQSCAPLQELLTTAIAFAIRQKTQKLDRIEI